MPKRINYLFYLRTPKQSKRELLNNAEKPNEILLPIYFRITIDGKHAELSTGETVSPDNWNQARNRLKGNRIPLLPNALAIIEKYKSHPGVINKNRLLPIIANTKTNAYLKEIAMLCGIRKNLTFHMARHTFATTVTLTNGVPIETVSTMLGHASLKTTQIYAKVIENKISAGMLQLRDKIKPKLEIVKDDKAAL